MCKKCLLRNSIKRGDEEDCFRRDYLTFNELSAFETDKQSPLFTQTYKRYNM